MLYDEIEILSADNEGSRRAPTLISLQKVDFTKTYQIKN